MVEGQGEAASGVHRWVRWLWRALAIVCSLAVIDLVVSAGIRQVGRIRSERQNIETALTQFPYRGTDWGRAYWEEIARYEEQWDPYFVFRVGTMRGRFINVENGVRRTFTPTAPPPGRRPLVFVFGGSAVWGHGVSDDGTLPSWIARIADRAGTPLEVRNYAESAWVNWQGVTYLMQLLASGERPDAVVFYSGANEVLSGRQWPAAWRPIWDGTMHSQAMSELITQRHRRLRRAWEFYRDTSFVWSWLGGSARPPMEPLPSNVLVPKLADEYSRDRAVVENLGRTYGFSTLFVWQLTVADKKFPSTQERGYLGWLPQTPESKPAVSWWTLPKDLKDEYDAVGGLVVQRGAISISGAFGDMADTAFIDWMHPTEQGNERIAGELYQRLQPELTKRIAAGAQPANGQSLASITANPALSAGAGKGRTTVTWATRDGSPAQVYVSINGGPEILFAGLSPFGSQDADWIEPGTCDFRLYAGTDHTVLLASALVTRLPAQAGR